MFNYHQAKGELANAIRPYCNKDEVPYISDKIKYRNMTCREVIFYKKVLGGVKKHAEGIMYITDDGELVMDKNDQKELARLAYYFNIFFTDDKDKNIFRAIRLKSVLEREKGDFECCMKGLDYLKEKGISHTEDVKKILQKIPEMRAENNQKLLDLKAQVDKLKEEGPELDEEVMSGLYPIYEQVLETNFENIKVIDSGKYYYDDMKTITAKYKRNVRLAFRRTVAENLYKLDYQLGFFKKLLITYEKVLGMTTSQYRKFIVDIEKKNIEESLKLVRTNK